MKGHTLRHGKGWSHVVELGRDPVTGKRRQRWTSGFATEREALKDLRARLVIMDAGDDAFPAEITVASWSVAWLRHLETADKVRPRTRHSYGQLVRDHVLPLIGAMPMRRVKAAHVQSVLDAMTDAGRAPRTVSHCRAALSGMFRHATKMQVVPSNPVRDSEAPNNTRPTLRTPTAAELRAIIETARGTPWEVPVLLAATTGARRGEVLGLKWNAVDFDRGRLAITESLQRVRGETVYMSPKTPSGVRTVPLTAATVARLRQHRAEQAQRLLSLGVRQTDETPVCDRGDGTPCDPDSFTHAASRIATAAGVDGVRLHDLRHAVATLLAAERSPVELTSRMLGHSDVAFTLRVYTHPTDDLLDEVGGIIGGALSG